MGLSLGFLYLEEYKKKTKRFYLQKACLSGASHEQLSIKRRTLKL